MGGGRIPRAGAVIARTVAAMRHLARDPRLPKPLRWIAAVGLLPLPGPVDEAILVLIAPVFVLFYRTPVREAWQRAGQAATS